MGAIKTPVVHAFGFCGPNCDHAAPDPAQVVICRAWLKRWVQPRKSINAKRSSYGLKHDVERASRAVGVTYPQTDPQGRTWFGPYTYVTNGAFIRAALLEGYRAVQIDFGPNARFNMAFRREPVSIVETPVVNTSLDCEKFRAVEPRHRCVNCEDWP